MFRDQSVEIGCKVQGLKGLDDLIASVSARESSPEWWRYSVGIAPEELVDAVNNLCAVPPSLQIPVEDHAASFFFDNYVLEPSKTCMSVYEFLPALYSRNIGKNALHCIVTALGLAGLSHHSKEEQLMADARTWYTSALHMTNNALRDPSTMKADQTLISVILLGVYEVSRARTDPRPLLSLA